MAVTRPPAGWFHGIAGDLAAIYRQGLVDLGIEVFDVPVDAFFPLDLPRIARLTEELRAFAPELAIGLSHGSYALICRMPAGQDDYRRNLFTDVLDIPLLCLWDHPPLEFADQLLGPLPDTPKASRSGALGNLRRALRHPRMIHWSRDRGQTRIMLELDLIPPNRVIHVPAPALPPFSGHVPAPARPGAGFVGHVYQDRPPTRGPVVDGLTQQALAAWMARVASSQRAAPSLWAALAQGITALTAVQRWRNGLSRNQTYFWRLAHRFILHEAQTTSRLAALGAVHSSVACIGNLDAGAPGVPANLVASQGRVGFRDGLAEALSRTEVTLDVLNPGFIEGYSHKPVLGFAAGGFMLVNRVAGWVDAFGEAGAAASWTDHDDLATKLDRYLTRPALRQEIAATIRAEIAARHTLRHALTRVLAEAASMIARR